MRTLSKPGMSGKRGAALILEIIIYLVIVSLIAVAVTSGVRAVRDLVFAMHGRADAQNVRDWMEGRYARDGVYPGTPSGVGLWTFDANDRPQLTSTQTMGNASSISSINGANSGYCIVIFSAFMSDVNKQRFWIISTNPHKIMQGGTQSMVPAGQTTPPASGIPGLTCPN